MKISFAPALLLASLVPSTTGQSTSAAVDPLAVFGPEWSHVYGTVQVTVHNLKKKLAAKDIAFATQVLKRAYNTIHANLDDDWYLIDDNITAIEIKKEKKSKRMSGSEIFSGSLVETSEDPENLDWWWRVPKAGNRGAIYHHNDFGCHLCYGDDDALELSANTASPWGSNPQPVADLYCEIMKNEGDPAVFSKVHSCEIFPIDFVGAWDYEEAPASPAEANVAIALSGLSCADDVEACNDDQVRQLIVDAFMVAYNQVYFQDYVLEGFAPSSLIVYPAEDEAPLGSVRGAEASNLPSGTWRGTIEVDCRLCDPEHPVDPLAMLDKVEDIFCGLIAGLGNSDDAAMLSSVEGCSISSVQVVNPAEYRDLVVMEES